jgi:choline dehydrogenase-like flavoprotein
LKEILHTAFVKGTGLPAITDANGGNPIGIAPYTENWHNGMRQPAGKAYGLKGVDVLTNSTVRRIILENGVAKGAELTDGRKLMAKREVVLACGAIRAPQVLLLSGIGPVAELSKNGIEQLVNVPDLGRNFHDHVCMSQSFKVRTPAPVMSDL